MHVRFAHLHVVQARDRVEGDLARLGGLAHHLAVHLAVRRHIHHQVALNLRLAGQAPARGERPAPSEVPVRLRSKATDGWRCEVTP